MTSYRGKTLLVFLLILLFAAPLPAQDLMRNALKELFARLTSGQTDLQNGMVESVELLDDNPEMISLHVKIGESAGNSERVLTALVRNQGISFAQAFVPPLKFIRGAGDHKIFIKRKHRNREITSDAISVMLIDISRLQVVDSLSYPLAKQWGSSQPAMAGAVQQDPPGSDQVYDPGSAGEEPEIPEDIEIRPVPMGNTPTADEQREDQSSEADSLATDNPVVADTRLQVKPQLRIQQPLVRLAMVNLTGLASEARWTNGVKTLRFNVDGKEDGTARVMSKAYLNDGKLYKNVLYTHCRWADRGYVSGTFQNVTIPTSATKFSAAIGFIRGAARAGKFDYVVRLYPLEGGLKPMVIAKKRISYQSGVTEISAPVPKEFQGVKCNVALSVQAVGSSTQGWTVWYNPTFH